MSNPGLQSFIEDDKREDFLENGSQMQAVIVTVIRKMITCPPPFEFFFLHAYWFETYFVVLSTVCLSLGITSVDRVSVDSSIVRLKM